MNLRPRVRTVQWAAIVALALLAASACAVNPVTGQRELILMSPEREAQVGAQAAEQVKQEMGLVQDPALSAYVSAIGQRLAAASPRQDVQYRFHVVDMPEANAFALPGGYIYVSRGLLALTNDEDELANVVGHEIGHVAARHSAQRQTAATGVGIASVLGAVLAGALGGADAAQTVGQIGQVAGAGLIASYGRDQEREADRVGQKMAASTGWDPRGMPEFLSTLERETTLMLGQPRAPTFFDSHPATPERVQNTRTYAQTLPRMAGQPIASTRADFLRRIQGILIGTDPAEGVIEDNRFLHAGLDFHIRFPGGWKVQNGKTAVGALQPEQKAQIVLEAQGRGSDPAAAAAAWLQQQNLQVVDQGARRIGPLRGYRVIASGNTQSGPVGVDVGWVAHEGTIFRITGITASGTFQAYRPSFDQTIQSFRPLTPGEVASMVELRLDFAAARAGESLAQFSSRTGNAWNVEKTAVANQLLPSDRLQAGQLLKIAVARRWRPTR